MLIVFSGISNLQARIHKARFELRPRFELKPPFVIYKPGLKITKGGLAKQKEV